MTYGAKVPAGVRVGLYASNGDVHKFLGYARRHGALTFNPDVATTGEGRITAVESSGGLSRRVLTVVSFRNVAVGRPAQVRGLRLMGSELVWRPVCGAVSYSISVVGTGVTEMLTTASTRIKLPKEDKRVSVSVTGVTALGRLGAATTHRYARVG